MHINEFLCKSSKIERVIHVLESVLSVLFWVLMLYGFEEAHVASTTLLCVLIHEIGHECWLLFTTGGFGTIKGITTGFKIKRKRMLSYGKELGLYLSGAGANLVAVVVALPFIKSGNEYAEIFAALNAATAAANLLPVRGYDGYGAIMTCLDAAEATLHLYRILEIISCLISVLAVMLSLYLMARVGEGYWIFAVFFVAMLSELDSIFKK